MTRSRRELLLCAAFAVWGLAIAIALITVFRRPAPADQLMGLAKVKGFDAHGPLRWMAALVLMPILVPLVLRPLAVLLARGRTWAVNAAIAAPVATLWLVTVERTLLRALLPCAIALVLALVFRNRELRFTRHDAVLVPVLITTLIAIIDLAPAWGVASHVSIAALLVLALRIAVTFVPSPLPPALAFLVAPLGFVLQTGFFARDQRYFGWHVLVLVVVSPFALRFLARNRRRSVRALVLLVFPLALFAYWQSLNTMTAEGKPRVNYFEDGHALLPASEYLRGERPYRDILPAHGLIEDGFFDYVVFQTGDVTVGRTLKVREVAGTLTAVALYVLAWAVTGSPYAALLTTILAIMAGVFSPTIRVLPAIATLALTAGAARWRRPAWFALAGAGVVVCGATSLDYGAYTFLTLVVAVLRARTLRASAMRWTAIGVAAAVVPLFLGFAVLGVLGDFVRSTFFEIPAVAPAYTLDFFTPPQALLERPFFPEALSLLLDRSAGAYVVWAAIAVFVGVVIARRWPRRFEPLVLVGVWSVLTGISYAERHHLYFRMSALVMFAGWIVRAQRRFLLLAVAVVLANPTTHLAVLAINRAARGPAPEWVEIKDIPRAAGAYWHVSDARAIASVKKYIDLSLKPDETFLDFTNSGILYFVFRRDSPIRQYEVAFFQTEDQQREVIRRIESNPKVRAVAVTTSPHGRITVDVPNAWRAPLVQQYIETHFEPDFEEGEIAFWRRK